MAHLWFQDADGCWAALPLGAQSHCLRGDDGDSPVLLRTDDTNEETYLLVTGEAIGVRVNGTPLDLGVRVLSHLDEITDAGLGRVYFSDTRQARVEPCSRDDKPTCPRCKLPIDKDSPAVKCPGDSCGVWHHQNDELPCWTYAEHCAQCSQTTELDAGFQWTPEEI
jgi:hypothetical protein